MTFAEWVPMNLQNYLVGLVLGGSSHRIVPWLRFQTDDEKMVLFLLLFSSDFLHGVI